MEQVVAKLIATYVDELQKRGTLESEPVERAFRKVERHRLLGWFHLKDEKGDFEYAGKRFTKRAFGPQDPDPELLKIIYSDEALLTRLDPPSSTFQPSPVAQMLELLELERGMNVLEIGAGTGYNAALMQEIVGKKGRIATIDIQEDVVEQARRLLEAAGYGKIEVIAKDGALGHSPNAPYDRIIATVGCPDISFRWVEQLADDGFMLIPLQHGCLGSNPLIKICQEDSRLLGRVVDWSGFMSIQGELALGEEVTLIDPWSFLGKQPTAECPLFSFFREVQELKAKERRERYSSFLFYMSMIDKRACWDSLIDEQDGAIIIDKERIALYGDETLYHDLKKLHDQWEELGRPGLSAWRLEFFPRDQASETIEGERVWVIERKFSSEIIRLTPSRR